jgi:hypothetical protein
VGAEKHGYCMQDNKTYDAWFNEDGSGKYRNIPADDPAAPDTQKGVYWETTSCGRGLPNALVIVHGLSKGWGDTYPSTLPDQAIDVTGVEPGEYIVEVHADAREVVTESDEENNTASVHVLLTPEGDVTVLTETAVDGLP